MAGGEGETTLEYTPTWVVAVCLKKKNKKPLFEALQKIKEELMLLGFISLLLTVFQQRIAKICITEQQSKHWLPCNNRSDEYDDDDHESSSSSSYSTTKHFQTRTTTIASASSFVVDHIISRRLLAADSSDYCSQKGKVPLLSTTALHHLHIFIFVLAVVHVTFCALTIIFGGIKRSFFKQFYGSVTKTDYMTLRLGFIMLLLAVGTKLEHVITQLAHEVAEKHVAIEGDLVVRPSDDHFWFHRPRLVLLLIHIILFQNSFELAFFFWIWMGSSFKKAIFEDYVQEGLVGWARQARKNRLGGGGLKRASNGNGNGSSQVGRVVLFKHIYWLASPLCVSNLRFQ
ncbi:MLO-like protein 1 [Morus notabilis]|uniref:MLO-like protein 1 n=1 Tax=Morus notabilis TaxID=981085 RepID=W9RFA0_9ROSA|nr:MLO-like protein 1 [Morus notabilis]